MDDLRMIIRLGSVQDRVSFDQHILLASPTLRELVNMLINDMFTCVQQLNDKFNYSAYMYWFPVVDQGHF